MPEYLFVLHDPLGKVTGEERQEFASDQLALNHARKLRNGHTVEIKLGDLWVGSVTAMETPVVPAPDAPRKAS